MAPRKQKPAPAPAVVAEPTVEQPAMTYITNPTTVAHQTPNTRDDIAIRDAVRARLAVIENAIVEFVARYRVAGRGHRLHEISRFVHADGRWLYVDGDIHPA